MELMTDERKSIFLIGVIPVLCGKLLTLITGHAYFVGVYMGWIQPQTWIDATLVAYGLTSAGIGLMIEELGYAGMLAVLANPWLVAFVAGIGA
jgi:hypothetical protein